MRAAILSFLLALAAGCGGYDNYLLIIEVNGAWGGTLIVASDQCSTNSSRRVEKHDISSDGDQVTLRTADGGRFEGNALSRDSFDVERATVQSIERISYRSINKQSAQVTVTHISTGGSGCTSSWAGVMRHQ
jgi:hypothetical protein